MTRQEANESYEFAFGHPSICNKWEVEAILNEYDSDEDLVLDAMYNRRGTPSPRGPCPFLNLPQSRADEVQIEFNVMSHLPDVNNIPALKRYVCIRFKLHPDNDLWLINVFVEKLRTLGN